MPIQPTFPGVYIQEVPSGVKTITGVATSIAAFFGRTAQGPINKAVRCLSYADFLREFGGPHPLSDLAQSVRQFFDNGGTDCYVVRLAQGATAASVTLRNLANTQNILTATAKAAGTWGQDVKLEVDYNTTNPDDTFNLRVIYESNGSVISQETFNNLSMNPSSPRFAPTLVTQSSKLIDLSLHANMLAPNPITADPTLPTNFINLIANTPAAYSQSRRVFSADTVAPGITPLFDVIRNQLNAWLNPAALADRRSRFILNVNGTQDVPINLGGLDFTTAVTVADIAAIIQGNPVFPPVQASSINTQLAAAVAGLSVAVNWDILAGGQVVLRLTSTTTPFTSVRVQRATQQDLAALMMLGVEQGGIEVARYSNLRPVPNGTIYTGGAGFGNFTVAVNDFADLAQNAVTSVRFDAALPSPPAAVNVNLATFTPPAGVPGPFNYQNSTGGSDGVREKLQIIADAVNNDVNSPCSAELWGYHLAFKRKQGSINDSSTFTTIASATLGTGFTRNIRRYSLGTLSTSMFQSGGTAGFDGNAPALPDYLGNPVTHTGFYALDTVDLFNLMVLPGDREVSEATATQLIGPASTYCQQRRAFLLVDAPTSWTINNHPNADATVVNNLRVGIVKDHSAVFYPRVLFSDAGVKKLIGASGMVAGLMSRTDSQRGIWKAPAGVEADLRGVLDLEINMTDLENGVLNKLGVNCLRKFPNGIVNWGARTLDGSDDFGSEWKYIPIRRLALFIEESLFRGTKWVVFEPNDEPLWAKIRLNVGAFMMSLFRQGAFQGSTPDKAFYVKCDAETTTQNDRNLGIVNIEVGFAPLKPAEFVIIKIQQMAGDLT